VQTCPLLRMSPARNARHDSAAIRLLFAVVVSVAGMIGWRKLQSLLAAIPDSNDDFAAF